MAKKKNTTKKHKFKHVEAAAAAQTPGVSAASGSEATRNNGVTAPKAALAGATLRDFSYVAGDLRRIGVMAAALVALEAGLYFVLVHTSVGAAIYSLVKV